nr:hypothetical protein [Tanacetum cinerariifolium]
DQAIQTILLGLPEDIYAAVDSCETTQEIWLRVKQTMKGSDIEIQEKKAKLFNEWERESEWIENGNLVAVRAEGNAAGHNGNHIRCYNYRRLGHFARDCTNDNNVISEVTNVEQDGEIVEQHSANFEKTRALYESLYQNLAVEVEKVNSVNRKL